MVRRLGIIRNGYSQPLFHALRSPVGPEFEFKLSEDTPANLSLKLRQGELDAAFLSPIDYALGNEQFRIIPEAGLISAGESRAVRLQFKANLSQIRSVAVTPDVSASDVVLARLILAEKYELAPGILPVSEYSQPVSQKADAILVTGDEVPADRDIHQLDLVDEWGDVTELPYVHGMWVATKEGLSGKEVRELNRITQKGVAEYRFSGPVQLWFEEHFAYQLHEDAMAALGEFLNMAYYHGILKELVVPRFLDMAASSKPLRRQAPGSN